MQCGGDWVGARNVSAPESTVAQASFAPIPGLGVLRDGLPIAYAMGCYLAPLPGLWRCRSTRRFV